MADSFNIPQDITTLILKKLEAGTAPWMRPWNGTPVSFPMRQCGTPYKGINMVLLWAIADTYGYTSPYWLTYTQSAKLGGQVRKGQKASRAVFYKTLGGDDVDDDNDAGSGDTSTPLRRVLRSYAIFNADQIDGLPERYHACEPAPLLPPSQHQIALEHFFDAIPARVHHGGSKACYDVTSDTISLPPATAFHSIEHYASCRGHETLHWSGAAHRLNRDFSGRFGSTAYAFEELVVSIGQSMLCARLGLPDSLHDTHASYIASWIEVLKNDKSTILTAAARAEAACGYLYALSDPDVVRTLKTLPHDQTLAA